MTATSSCAPTTSVVQIVDGAPAFLRRARGSSRADRPRRGRRRRSRLGGHLKATLTVTRGREAFVSPACRRSLRRRDLRFHPRAPRICSPFWMSTPEAVACDLHPDYLSTRFAEEAALPVCASSITPPISPRSRPNIASRRLLGVGARRAWPRSTDGEHGVASRCGSTGRVDPSRTFRAAGACPAERAPHANHGGWRSPRPEDARAARPGGAAFRRSRPKRRSSPDVRAARPTPSTTSLGRLFDAASGACSASALRQDYRGPGGDASGSPGAKAPRALKNGFLLRDGVVDFSALLAHFIDARPDAREGAELLHGTVDRGSGAWLARAGATRAKESRLAAAA